jgi:hypothetical protein
LERNERGKHVVSSNGQGFASRSTTAAHEWSQRQRRPTAVCSVASVSAFLFFFSSFFSLSSFCLSFLFSLFLDSLVVVDFVVVVVVLSLSQVRLMTIAHTRASRSWQAQR